MKEDGKEEGREEERKKGKINLGENQAKQIQWNNFKLTTCQSRYLIEVITIQNSFWSYFL